MQTAQYKLAVVLLLLLLLVLVVLAGIQSQLL